MSRLMMKRLLVVPRRICLSPTVPTAVGSRSNKAIVLPSANSLCRCDAETVLLSGASFPNRRFADDAKHNGASIGEKENQKVIEKLGDEVVVEGKETKDLESLTVETSASPGTVVEDPNLFSQVETAGVAVEGVEIGSLTDQVANAGAVEVDGKEAEVENSIHGSPIDLEGMKSEIENGSRTDTVTVTETASIVDKKEKDVVVEKATAEGAIEVEVSEKLTTPALSPAADEVEIKAKDSEGLTARTNDLAEDQIHVRQVGTVGIEEAVIGSNADKVATASDIRVDPVVEDVSHVNVVIRVDAEVLEGSTNETPSSTLSGEDSAPGGQLNPERFEIPDKTKTTEDIAINEFTPEAPYSNGAPVGEQLVVEESSPKETIEAVASAPVESVISDSKAADEVEMKAKDSEGLTVKTTDLAEDQVRVSQFGFAGVEEAAIESNADTVVTASDIRVDPVVEDVSRVDEVIGIDAEVLEGSVAETPSSTLSVEDTAPVSQVDLEKCEITAETKTTEDIAIIESTPEAFDSNVVQMGEQLAAEESSHKETIEAVASAPKEAATSESKAVEDGGEKKKKKKRKKNKKKGDAAAAAVVEETNAESSAEVSADAEGHWKSEELPSLADDVAIVKAAKEVAREAGPTQAKVIENDLLQFLRGAARKEKSPTPELTAPEAKAEDVSIPETAVTGSSFDFLMGMSVEQGSLILQRIIGVFTLSAPRSSCPFH